MIWSFYLVRALQRPTAICYGCGQLIENIDHDSGNPLWQHIATRFVECAGRPGHYAYPLGGAC